MIDVSPSVTVSVCGEGDARVTVDSRPPNNVCVEVQPGGVVSLAWDSITGKPNLDALAVEWNAILHKPNVALVGHHHLSADIDDLHRQPINVGRFDGIVDN